MAFTKTEATEIDNSEDVAGRQQSGGTPEEAVATTHLAGDVVRLPQRPANDNKNLDLGFPNEDEITRSWNSMAKKSRQPNLSILPGGKK